MPWAGWPSVVDTIGVYIAAQFAGALLVLSAGSVEDISLAVLVVASPLVLGLLTYAWMRVRYGVGVVAVTGRRRWRPSDLLIGAVVGVLAFVVVQQIVLRGVVSLFERRGIDPPTVQQTFRSIAQDPATVPLLIIAALVLAPLAEELLFRGVLFQGIRARRGFWVAALTSAAAFTLPHLGDGSGPIADLLIVAGIMPLGVVFAAVMERTGSLAACVAAHAVYNAIGVVLLLGTSSSPPVT